MEDRAHLEDLEEGNFAFAQKTGEYHELCPLGGNVSQG
jgi:hypothetical protein